MKGTQLSISIGLGFRKGIYFFLSIVNGFLITIGLGALISWQTINASEFINRVAAQPLLVFDVRQAVNGVLLENLNLSSEGGHILLGEQFLSNEQISATIEEMLRSFAKWLRDPHLDQPEIILDFRPLIKNIDSAEGRIALLSDYQSLPFCDKDQPAVDPLQQSMGCVQRNTNLSALVEAQVDLIKASLPEQLSFTELYQSNMIPEQLWQTMVQVKASFQGAMLGFRILGAVIVLLTLILLGINRVPLYRRISELRYSIYLAGIFSVFLWLGFYLVSFYLWKSIVPDDEYRYLPSIVQDYSIIWAGRWRFVVGALFTISLALTALDVLVRRTQRRLVPSAVANPSSKVRYRKEFR